MLEARSLRRVNRAGILRRGALEDIDNVSWLCQPAHPSWDILLNAFHTVFHAGGGDGFVGRRLPVLLHAAGVRNIQTQSDCRNAAPRRLSPHASPLARRVRRDEIVAKGVLDDAKLNEHGEALAQHLNDPATIVIDKLLVQCWGQKSR